MIDINTQNILSAAIESDETYPIKLSEVWMSLGYTLKRNAVRLIKMQLIEGEDYKITPCQFVLPKEHKPNPKGGRIPGKALDEYLLTPTAYKHLAMSAGTSQGRECRSYYIAIEEAAIARTRALLANTFTAAPVAPTPGLDAG